MAYTTEKFFAVIDAKNYINEFRRTDYFIEFCQQCKNYNHRYGCPPFDDETLSIVEGYEIVRIMGVKIIPYTKKFHGIAVTHPVSYNSVGVCGIFLPSDVCDRFVSDEMGNFYCWKHTETFLEQIFLAINNYHSI